MKKITFLLLIMIGAGGFNHPGKVGGPCEGCEAIYENTTPFEKLDMFVRLPDFNDNLSNRLGIHGTVYKADGKTPAPGVIIYVYHTNPEGVYPKKGDEKGWGKRHGYLRAWMKTDDKGVYKFMTVRPGAYPGRDEPAHIHMVVKEPDKNEYYIDEILFDDDPLVTPDRLNKLKNRGGSGVLHLVDVGRGLSKAGRNIYLGKHIPDYPVEK